jgi:hypothetical protein
VPVSLVAVERGAALVTGHVARPEHRSSKNRQPPATL